MCQSGRRTNNGTVRINGVHSTSCWLKLKLFMLYMAHYAPCFYVVKLLLKLENEKG